MKYKIAEILDDSTKYGRYFSWFIQGLIITSLISLGVQTLPDLPEVVDNILEMINIVCMLIFVTEYFLRLCIAFIGFLIYSQDSFDDACFDAGGIAVTFNSDRICISKDTEFLLRF